MTAKGFPIWCEIVCAHCSRQAPGVYAWGAPNRRVMKHDAKQQGFKFKHGEAFCSQACVELYEETTET